jgi:hypothetical protein
MIDIIKNAAGQWIDLEAVNADGFVTGDAANIRFAVNIDNAGTFDQLAANPTEPDSVKARGTYRCLLAQAETNGDSLRFTGWSTTPGVEIVPKTLRTRAQSIVVRADAISVAASASPSGLDLILSLVIYKNGLAADADALPVLSDPTGAFGARRLDTMAVVVADAEPFVHAGAGTGRYSKTIAGAARGVQYEWWPEAYVNGALFQEQRLFTTGPAILTAANQTAATIVLVTPNGGVWAGQALKYRLAKPPSGDGYGYDLSTKTSAVSDVNGEVGLTLLRSSEYQVTVAGGPATTLVTPDAPSCTIPLTVTGRVLE